MNNAEAIKTLERRRNEIATIIECEDREAAHRAELLAEYESLTLAIASLKGEGARLPDHIDTQADTRASMQPVVPVSPPGTGQLFPAGPPPAECRVFEYLKNHPRMSLGWQTGHGWFVVDFYSKDPAIMGHDVNELAAKLEKLKESP